MNSLMENYGQIGASQVALVVKNMSANAGDIRDVGRSPGVGNGNPLQYSCLENPMDRGAWRATVHGVKKGWIWLKQLSMHGQIGVKTFHILLSLYQSSSICPINIQWQQQPARQWIWQWTRWMNPCLCVCPAMGPGTSPFSFR